MLGDQRARDDLADMPRVMRYLRAAARRYRELDPLTRVLDSLDARPATVGLTF